MIRIDPASRRVIVGPRELLKTAKLCLRDVNWIGPGTLAAAAAEQRPLFVKVRSTQAARAARLAEEDGYVIAELEEPEFGVAAGQACVFYEDGSGAARVLGGGFIASATG